jgi:hypothetical protein
MTSFHFDIIFDLFSVQPDSNSIKNEIGHEKGQNKSPIYDHSSNTLVIFVLEIMTIKKVESVSNEEWMVRVKGMSNRKKRTHINR